MPGSITNIPVQCTRCFNNDNEVAGSNNSMQLGFLHNGRFIHLDCYAIETSNKINLESMRTVCTPEVIKQQILYRITGYLQDTPHDSALLESDRVALAPSPNPRISSNRTDQSESASTSSYQTFEQNQQTYVPSPDKDKTLRQVKQARIMQLNTIAQIQAKIGNIEKLKPISFSTKTDIEKLMQEKAVHQAYLLFLNEVTDENLEDRSAFINGNSELRTSLHYQNQLHQPYIAPKPQT